MVVNKLGAALSRATERWVPDAWVICLMLTVVALVLAWFGPGAELQQSVLAWGKGVWTLLELAMQLALAMVAAHACATARPVYRLLDRLAGLPDPDRPIHAVLLVGIFSLVTAYINWAVSLVVTAAFVPFVLRRNPLVDARLVVAAAYIGVGTVWHGGLSGSAPLILATPDNPLLAAGVVDRLYPITETIFNSFNLILLAIVAGVAVIVACLLHPPREDVVRMSSDGSACLTPAPAPAQAAATPAARIDRWRGWTWLAGTLLAYPLGYAIVTQGFGASWTINAYNTVFLALALLLHGRATAFLNACRDGTEAAWGIILQFPFYGGIFGILQYTGLGRWLGELFAGHATSATYPFLVYLYSAVMNLFVPSGGTKWLLEAPFLLPAGEALGVSPVTVLLAYCYGDSTTNLIQPFFAIPILAATGLKFGQIVGYTAVVAMVVFALNSAAMFLIPLTL